MAGGFGRLGLRGEGGTGLPHSKENISSAIYLGRYRMSRTKLPMGAPWNQSKDWPLQKKLINKVLWSNSPG
jgi:hypothetical protein